MRSSKLPLTAFLLGSFASAAFAGHQINSVPGDGKDKVITPPEERVVAGSITLGGKFSEDLESGFFDALIPIAHLDEFTGFVSGRATIDDHGQQIYSGGGVARYRVPGQEVIIGGNVFYDSVESRRGYHYDQLGLGVEVLTHWVDARFNYYLPDNDRHEIARSHSTQKYQERSTDSFTDVERRTDYRRYEAALKGWNAEVGFLVPGLDRYAEVRVFGGYYRYENPFGGSYEGFKARVEARPVPGLIAGVEYWQDAALMGGNWTAEVQVSVPFDIGNIARGRNPFEGAGDAFKPRVRQFDERMGEMVVRSHRVMTVGSDPIRSGGRTTRSTTDLVPQAPAVPPAPPRPPVPIE